MHQKQGRVVGRKTAATRLVCFVRRLVAVFEQRGLRLTRQEFDDDIAVHRQTDVRRGGQSLNRRAKRFAIERQPI